MGPQDELYNAGTTLADLSWRTLFNDNLTTAPSYFSHVPNERLWDGAPTVDVLSTSNSVQQKHVTNVFDWGVGHNSSGHAATSMDTSRGAEDLGSHIESVQDPKKNRKDITTPHKRRRSGYLATNASLFSPIGLANSLTSSANANFLGDGLLRIYRDSFERHLSCWLTEKTCPSSKDCGTSLSQWCGPDWIQIYHRVFKLDQSAFEGKRPMSRSEDKAVSRALNLAIFSFASQWAVSDAERGSRYPFCISGARESRSSQPLTSQEARFDEALQLTAWHQAHNAVREAANIESFRMVLARMILSLTEKPRENSERMEDKSSCAQSHFSRSEDTRLDIDECDDMMGKLELTLNGDVPSLHLEQGLRLIHSLRSRMMMAGALGGRRKRRSRCWKHVQAPEVQKADGETVDLLFWLCVMFDTLSSAIHKRPLVVPLEDSDLTVIRGDARDFGLTRRTQTPFDPRAEDLWDELLLSRQHERNKRASVSWPFLENEAASLLCEAAPIKVLLFRKVTRIQTLLSRHAQSEAVEAAVHSALKIYGYWQETYAPFLRDCIEHHADLTERVQSWHVCLAGHWHLATLLLADLLEIMDGTGAGCEASRGKRESLDFVAGFREENCRSLSDIARCACSQQDKIMSRTSGGPFSIGHGALLSEPWSDVLTRAYATAGAMLLQTATAPTASSMVEHDVLRRADDCIQALCLLGKRSAKAASVANILSQELSLRRIGGNSREYRR